MSLSRISGSLRRYDYKLKNIPPVKAKMATKESLDTLSAIFPVSLYSINFSLPYKTPSINLSLMLTSIHLNSNTKTKQSLMSGLSLHFTA
jgi:hypothetical protein